MIVYLRVSILICFSLYCGKTFCLESISYQTTTKYIDLFGFKSRYDVLKYIELVQKKFPTKDPLEMTRQYYALGIAKSDFEDIVKLEITPSQASVWTKVGVKSPDLLKFLKTKNISPQKVKEYKDLGIEDYGLDEILDANISFKMVKSYLDVGAKVDNITNYVREGLSPSKVKDYISFGVKDADDIVKIDQKLKGKDPSKVLQAYKDIYSDIDDYVLRKFITSDLTPQILKSYLDEGVGFEDISRFVKRKISISEIKKYKKLGFIGEEKLKELLYINPVKDEERIKDALKNGIKHEEISSYFQSGLSFETFKEYSEIGISGIRAKFYYDKKISPKDIKELYDIVGNDQSFISKTLSQKIFMATQDGKILNLKKLLQLGIRDRLALQLYNNNPLDINLIRKILKIYNGDDRVLFEYYKDIKSGSLTLNDIRSYAAVSKDHRIRFYLSDLIENKISPEKLKRYLDIGLDVSQVLKVKDIPFERVKAFASLGFSSREFIDVIKSDMPIGEIPSLSETCKSSSEVDEAYCRFISTDLISKYQSFFSSSCLASQKSLRKNGLKIPKCPKNGNFRGLPNTYPSAGTFIMYTRDNFSLIEDLYKSMPKDSTGKPISKLNILIPMQQDQKYLVEFISKLEAKGINKHINLVPVHPSSIRDRWTQDKIEFGSIRGKPSIYIHNHEHEQFYDLNLRLGCQIGKMCNLPVVNSRKEIKPFKDSHISGGNWEVLPGGSFFTGGYSENLSDKDREGKVKLSGKGYVTKPHYEQIRNIEKQGNRVTLIDTKFLRVGHVDEIINVVKTKGRSPCDFAIMRASPKLGIDLMRKSKRLRSKESDIKACSELEASKVSDRFYDDKKVDIDKDIKNHDCYGVSGYTTSKFLAEKDLIEHNEKIEKIMRKNEEIVISDIKRNTKCKNPKVIPVPVTFDLSGDSLNPDSVNGVSYVKRKGAHLIAPKSFYSPYDDYVTKELKKVGVSTSLVEDLEYHIEKGEVHCGTNSVPVCTPE